MLSTFYKTSKVSFAYSLFFTEDSKESILYEVSLIPYVLQIYRHDMLLFFYTEMKPTIDTKLRKLESFPNSLVSLSLTTKP